MTIGEHINAIRELDHHDELGLKRIMRQALAELGPADFTLAVIRATNEKGDEQWVCHSTPPQGG